MGYVGGGPQGYMALVSGVTSPQMMFNLFYGAFMELDYNFGGLTSVWGMTFSFVIVVDPLVVPLLRSSLIMQVV